MLQGVRWVLVSYLNAAGETAEALADREVTAEFNAAGQMAGSAGCKVVILQMHRLVLLDTTGLLALDELNDKLRQGGRALVLCGAGGDTAKMLVDSQLAEHVGERNVQPDLAAALTRAQELLRTDSV